MVGCGAFNKQEQLLCYTPYTEKCCNSHCLFKLSKKKMFLVFWINQSEYFIFFTMQGRNLYIFTPVVIICQPLSNFGCLCWEKFDVSHGDKDGNWISSGFVARKWSRRLKNSCLTTQRRKKLLSAGLSNFGNLCCEKFDVNHGDKVGNWISSGFAPPRRSWRLTN